MKGTRRLVLAYYTLGPGASPSVNPHLAWRGLGRARIQPSDASAVLALLPPGRWQRRHGTNACLSRSSSSTADAAPLAYSEVGSPDAEGRPLAPSKSSPQAISQQEDGAASSRHQVPPGPFQLTEWASLSKLLSERGVSDTSPSAETFASVIELLINDGASELAAQLVYHLHTSGSYSLDQLFPEPLITRLLANQHLRDNGWRLFASLSEHFGLDTEPIGIKIAMTLVEQAKVKEASQALTELVGKGLMLQSATALNRILRTCGAFNRSSLGLDLVKASLEYDTERNVETLNAFIALPSVTNAYKLDKALQDAIALLGVEPNAEVFEALISILLSRGQAERAESILQLMSNKYGLKPTLRTLQALGLFYLQRGRTDKVEHLVETAYRDLALTPHIELFNLLLAAYCQEHDNEQLADQAEQKALRLFQQKLPQWGLMPDRASFCHLIGFYRRRRLNHYAEWWERQKVLTLGDTREFYPLLRDAKRNQDLSLLWQCISAMKKRQLQLTALQVQEVLEFLTSEGQWDETEEVLSALFSSTKGQIAVNNKGRGKRPLPLRVTWQPDASLVFRFIRRLEKADRYPERLVRTIQIFDETGVKPTMEICRYLQRKTGPSPSLVRALFENLLTHWLPPYEVRKSMGTPLVLPP